MAQALLNFQLQLSIQQYTLTFQGAQKLQSKDSAEYLKRFCLPYTITCAVSFIGSFAPFSLSPSQTYVPLINFDKFINEIVRYPSERLDCDS